MHRARQYIQMEIDMTMLDSSNASVVLLNQRYSFVHSLAIVTFMLLTTHLIHLTLSPNTSS